jgi:lysozyme
VLTITYNAQYCPKRHRAARREHIAAFDRLAALRPVATGICEAGGYRKELRHVDGYQVIQPHGAAGKCALLIRADVKVHDHGTIKLHGRKFVGRDVPGARHTGITSARYIVWALITDPETGQLRYVAVWHPVPGQSHSKRARALLAAEGRVAATWLAKLPHPADLMGDCNGQPDLPLFAPLRKVASHAFAPSRHGDAIDGHWITDGTADATALDGYPSDHKPVRADITWSAQPKPAPNPHKEPAMSARVDLVDLSHWNSDPNFRALKAVIKGAYHKATEGKKYVDPEFNARRRAADGLLPFGGYHFARPSLVGKAEAQGVAQAKRFLAVATPRPGDLRPMLDFESRPVGFTRKRSTLFAKGFAETVQAATGVPPLIYTHFDLNRHFDCPLWVARYSDSMLAPSVPKPWSAWSVWQFSNGQFGVPNNIGGYHCDLNTFNSGIDIDVLTIPTPKAQPAPEKPAEPAKPTEPVATPKPRPYNERQAITFTRKVIKNAKTAARKLRFRTALSSLLGRKKK